MATSCGFEIRSDKGGNVKNALEVQISTVFDAIFNGYIWAVVEKTCEYPLGGAKVEGMSKQT